MALFDLHYAEPESDLNYSNTSHHPISHTLIHTDLVVTNKGKKNVKLKKHRPGHGKRVSHPQKLTSKLGDHSSDEGTKSRKMLTKLACNSVTPIKLTMKKRYKDKSRFEISQSFKQRVQRISATVVQSQPTELEAEDQNSSLEHNIVKPSLGALTAQEIDLKNEVKEVTLQVMKDLKRNYPRTQKKVGHYHKSKKTGQRVQRGRNGKVQAGTMEIQDIIKEREYEKEMRKIFQKHPKQ